MFQGLRDRRKIRSLQRNKRAITAELLPEFRREDGMSDQQGDFVWEEWRSKIEPIDREIAEIQATRLREQAELLLVPMPEEWKRIEGPFGLSESASHDLRAAIRRERKERREMWMPYVSIVAAIVSVCGAILSVWRGFQHP
jgi:hypothetical protein